MRTPTLTLAISLALVSAAAFAQDTTTSVDPVTGRHGIHSTPGAVSPDSSSAIATSGTDNMTRSNREERMANLTSASFVEKAAQGGMTEVQASKLALQKSSNDDVKTFANQMVNDHTQANDELKTAATSKGLTVPGDLDAKHKAAIAKLSSKSGAGFDRAYAQQMSKDHDKTVALFRNASSADGVDSDLQAWAKKTLPTLEHHDQMAMQLKTSVDKGAAASTSSDR